MRVLLVEDNPGDALLVRELLRFQPNAPTELAEVGSLSAASQRLETEPYDALLLDLGLPDSQGLETFERLSAAHPELPVVVLSGLGDEAVALRAVQAGAQDFLVKGEIDGDLLVRALRYAVERQQGKAELRASASSWQATFDAIGDAVSLLDADQRILRSNTAMQNLTGLTAEDLRGRFCYEVVHDQCEPLADCPFHRMCDSRARCSMKLESGSTCYQIHVDPLFDEHGALVGAVHTIADVTVQHQAARATARSERQHRILGLVGRALLEHEDHALWFEVSRILCEGFISPRGLVGVVGPKGDMTLHDFDLANIELESLPPARVLPASHWRDAPWAVALRERRTSHFSVSSTWDPLGPRPVRRLVVVPLQLQGEIHGMLALADAGVDYQPEDLSLLELVSQQLAPVIEARARQQEQKQQRRQAEDALRVSEGLHRSLLHALPDGVLQMDLEGIITYASPRAAELLRCPGGGALTGGASLATVVLEDRDQAQAFVARTLEHGGSGAEILVRERPDGSRFPCEVSGTLVRDAAGEPASILCVLRDLSEKHEAKRALREAKEQLVEAQRLESLGRLAGGVAHDFNNLLGVVLTTTELIAQDHDDPELRDDLDQIAQAATRAAALTQQLLAFGRRQVLSPVILDLNGVVRELDRMLRLLLGEDVQLVLDLAPDLGLVEADPTQIEQVLMNLVVNARDAMPLGGRIVIRTADLDVDEDDRALHPTCFLGSLVLLSVSDTGHGMDEQVQSRLFEPFYTTKEQGRGTGLGLATVYGIVQQSHGTIHVHSAPGQGASFEVCLPRREGLARVGTGRPSLSGAAARGEETILLVEDEEPLRQAVARTLERAGYQVLCAGSLDQALAVLDVHVGPVHLLLTDVVLPGPGGRVVAETLRERLPGLRVIYTSGFAQDAITQRGVDGESGMFLQKPVFPRALVGAVRAVLDGGGVRG